MAPTLRASLSPCRCADRRGVEDIDRAVIGIEFPGSFLLLRFLLLAAGGIARFAGGFAFRHHQLGEEQAAGRGHEGGGQEIFQLHADLGVAGQDGTGDGGHAATHDGEEFRSCHARDERPDDEGGFRHPDEDIRAGGE